MILISTLRKMIQKDPNARVARMRVDAYHVNIPGLEGTKWDATEEFFATEKQMNEAMIHKAKMLRACQVNPATLIHTDFVHANEAAKAQGFDFLR